MESHNLSGQSPAHLPPRPLSSASRAISPFLGTPLMGTELLLWEMWNFGSSILAPVLGGGSRCAVLGKVLRSFQLFQDKSSAGKPGGPFHVFILPPTRRELADIFGVKFLLKYAQRSGGTVSILSCLLKKWNSLACLLSLSLCLSLSFFLPPNLKGTGVLSATLPWSC